MAARNIYARRARDRVFRAEMDKARAIASDRLEGALHERATAALCGDGADDLWAEETLGGLPEMSVDQALMLLRFHMIRQALGDEWGRYATRKRRGALSSAEYGIERQIWWEGEQERRRLDEVRRKRAARRAKAYEKTGNWFLPGEKVPDALVERRKRPSRK